MVSIKFRDKILWRVFLMLSLILVYTIGCKKESVFQKRERAELIIRPDDPRLKEQMIHLYSDTVYILVTDLNIESGQTLSIDAGTIIKVSNKIAVTINEGARIEARGTMTKPVVFTSSAPKGGAGVGTGTVGGERWWYGIRIFGNHLSNPTLGSGILSYVRVEFAGGNENFSGLAALLFQNVSRETIIENIQVSYSFLLPSFGFYGGNCNASNLVSYASGHTDFHIDQGYKGLLQNLLAYRHPYFPVPGSSGTGGTDFAGLLIDGTETFPTVSNITVIGPDLQKGTSEEYSDTLAPGRGRRVAAMVAKGGSRFHIRNAAFFGFPEAGFYIGERTTAMELESGVSDFTYSIAHSNDSGRVFFLPSNVYPPFTSDNFKAFTLQPQFNNQLFITSSAFMLTDPFNYDINPNPLPAPGSPVVSGANFDAAPFTDLFFKKVNYRGAIGTDNWLQGWINFIPLQTNYNN